MTDKKQFDGRFPGGCRPSFCNMPEIRRTAARTGEGGFMTAQFWEALPGDAVRCGLCAHACRIPRNGKGICGMRVNLRGKLVSLSENIMTSPHLDPVEKKPLYHFLPGSKVFSFGSVGCNFSCKFCQNFAISCLPSKSGSVTGQRVEPVEVFRLAEQQRSSLVAFTYNEPTVSFELMFAVAGLLQTTEKRCIMVTNGFMSEDCLLSLRRRISAANVDLKSFRESFYRDQCGGRLAPVLDNLKTIRKIGWWLEVTTLVIPGLNDSDDEIRDIESINAFHELTSSGAVSPEDMMRFIGLRGRDNARTPMQWDDSKNAGFTSGTPWIKVNPNYKEINAAAERKDPDSVFCYYQKLIALRKREAVMVYGSYELQEPDSESLYVYTRTLEPDRLLVICSFSETETDYEIPAEFSGAEILIGNGKRTSAAGLIRLQPYEALVLKRKMN